MPEPCRGEVWIVDLGYVAKVRPCLVLSVALQDTDRKLVACVEHTTSKYGSRFEVAVETNFLKSSGVFNAQGIVTVPVVKLQRKIGQLDAEQLGRVEEAIKRWLGLSSTQENKPA